MADTEPLHQKPDNDSWTLRVILFLVLFSLGVGGYNLLLRFTALKYDQEVQYIATRMQKEVQAKAQKISTWLSEQKNAAMRIARHPGITVYVVSAMDAESTSRNDEAMAHQTYLANYLTIQAEKLGYTQKNKLSEQVKASVGQPELQGGVVIIGMNGKVVTGSGVQRSLPKSLVQWIVSIKEPREQLAGVFLLENQQPVQVSIAPVYPEQSLENTAEPVAWVAGLAPLSRVYQLLQTYPDENIDRFQLLQRHAGSVEYLSPGNQVKKPVMPSDRVAAMVAGNADFKGVVTTDSDDSWLAVGGSIPEAGWVLSYREHADTILANAQETRLRMLAIGGLLIVCVLVILVAVWRHFQGLQSAREALRYQKLSEILADQKQLLRCVSDIQPDPMMLCDSSGMVRFANAALCRLLAEEESAIVEKSLGEVFGANLAQQLMEQNRAVLESGETIHWDQKENTEGCTLYRYRHVPVNELPALFGDSLGSGVLVLWLDITLQVREQKRQATMQRQLLGVLLSLLDQHDPYAAEHSRRVADLSARTAGAMGLALDKVETARLAGGLANLGKILVPQEVLTKKDALNSGEKEQLAQAQEKAMRLLQEVSFPGPVTEVISQSSECWDGSGRLGLKGEEILTEARIVAVANACVAMTSERAFRQAMDKTQVESELLEQADTKYNRAAVAALLHVLETGN